MAKAKLYNKLGELTGEIKLNPVIFEVEPNKELIHQAVVTLLANRRQVLAHTKVRGEVRGGGRKPWKQKGTGRARQGSIRSPQWKGGAVIFGPTKDVNFTKKINSKMKKKALFMVLSDKAVNENILAIEAFELKEGKTKEMIDLTKKMALGKKNLLVLEKMDKKVVNAARNLVNVEVISANSLNIYDVMNSRTIVFAEGALKKVEEVFLK
ncbi:MAG: 50S ribosomal protein L4 [Patescibacteria group bacterium]